MVWGPVIAAGAGLLGTILSNKSANKRARQEMDYLNKVQGVGEQYLTPFINRGAQAQDMTSQAYQQMLQNPTTFVEQLMSSYKPSQGYQFRQKSALDAARNSAAAGGFSGTGYDQRQQAELVSGLLGQDMQQYLQNVLGVQGTGLAGQQHVGDMGYQAAGGLADYIGNAYGNQSKLRQAQNMQAGAGVNNLLGSLSGLLGAGMQVAGSGQFGAKGTFGGPGGALSKIFGGFK